MTKLRRELIPSQLRLIAKGNGWKEDKYGSLRKVIEGKEYRLKFKQLVVRLEVKSNKKWKGIDNLYYSSISITDVEGLNKLRILSS